MLVYNHTLVGNRIPYKETFPESIANPIRTETKIEKCRFYPTEIGILSVLTITILIMLMSTP